jgi:spermidine synthase
MLLFFTLVIAICWILYELTIWTLSSYLIWDSIKQFSFVIWFFLSGMWIGAYLSRYLEKNALKNFLKVELLISVLWASSVIILKYSYILLWNNDFIFQIIYFLLTIWLGTLVWIEIPMVAEVYKQLKIKTKSIISDIFTFDYIWGLLASLLFPIILLPYLGLYNISIFIWNLNLLVAFLYLNYIKKKNNKLKVLDKQFFIKYYLIIFWVCEISIIFGSSSTRVIFLIKSYFNKFLTANQSHHHKTRTEIFFLFSKIFIGQSTKASWYLCSSKLLNWIFQLRNILKSSHLFVKTIFWYWVW